MCTRSGWIINLTARTLIPQAWQSEESAALKASKIRPLSRGHTSGDARGAQSLHRDYLLPHTGLHVPKRTHTHTHIKRLRWVRGHLWTSSPTRWLGSARSGESTGGPRIRYDLCLCCIFISYLSDRQAKEWTAPTALDGSSVHFYATFLLFVVLISFQLYPYHLVAKHSQHRAAFT